MKLADPEWLPRLATRIWMEAVGHGHFAPYFGSRVVLIPVPGSTPELRPNWVGERLGWCLKEIGLAGAVWPILRRRCAVRKSAFAAAGERPSVLQHYASFAIERAPCGGAPMGQSGFVHDARGTRLRLTLIDDVITRGRTLLAAAGRLRDAFPSAEIHAFALLRTLGPGEQLTRVLDPCEGEVRWISGDARRRP